VCPGDVALMELLLMTTLMDEDILGIIKLLPMPIASTSSKC
jgi:hypothetical protein